MALFWGLTTHYRREWPIAELSGCRGEGPLWMAPAWQAFFGDFAAFCQYGRLSGLFVQHFQNTAGPDGFRERGSKRLNDLKGPVTLSTVFAVYVFAAETARRTMKSTRAVRNFNRATATALGGAAAWIAIK